MVGGHPTEALALIFACFIFFKVIDTQFLKSYPQPIGWPSFSWRLDLRLPSRSHPRWTFETPGWTGGKFCPMPQVPSVPSVPCSPKKIETQRSKTSGSEKMVGVRVWWSKKTSNMGFVEGIRSLVRYMICFCFKIKFHWKSWAYATIFEKMIELQEETSVLSALVIIFLDINLNRDQKWWVFWDPGFSEAVWNGWKVGLHGSSTASQKLMVSFGPPISCWKWLH